MRGVCSKIQCLCYPVEVCPYILYVHDYILYVHLALCYMEAWLDQLKRKVYRLGRNNVGMVRKICSVRSEDRISAGEVRPD